MISIIFDMDGTLLDTQKIVLPAWETAGINQGIKGLSNEVKNVCGMNCADWSRYLNENYPTLDTDKFNAEMRKYVKENIIVTYKTGGEEILKFLKQNGVKIAIASGSSMKSVKHHLKEVDAEKYFDVMLGGTDVQNSKPAPDIFLLAAQKMGVAPKDCIVFEDSKNGVKAAVAAGMRCIGIADIAEFPEDIKNLLFAEPKDFIEAIDILRPLL